MRHLWIAMAVALAVAGVRGAHAQAPADDKQPEAEAGAEGPAETEVEAEVEAEADLAPDPDTDAVTQARVTETDTETGSPAADYASAGPQANAPGARPLTATRAAKEEEDIIPLNVELHGYYRNRFSWIHNVPRADPDGPGPIVPGTSDLAFGVQRLRLEPTVTYGPKKDSPIAALRIQIDGLDDVVWGDNARLSGVPLFAENPTLTTIDGFDLQDSLYLKRAWLEFLVPVGQIRVGRMPSHWGEGILAHGGEGLAEWGDYREQSTFDRILFATRPLTIVNAITKDDSSPTPLIFAFAYDRLVEDPAIPSISSDPLTIRPAPIFSSVDERSTFPFQYLGGKNQHVNEIVFALAWSDDEFGRRATDHLRAGYYYVYRWQDSTNSDIFINDLMWDLQYGLGPGMPSLITSGEFLNITGKSGGLAFTGGCGEFVCNEGEASIFAVVGRAGVAEPGKYKAYLEAGFDSGDTSLLNPELKVRAFHPSYQVGMLMYRVALQAVSARGLGPLGLSALGANGSAWNTKYFWPQARYTLIPGVEVHGGVLLGWTHKLNPLVYGDTNDSCGFSSDCFLGWEVDAALRIRWGDNDLMWFDLESAIMKAGNALARDEGVTNPNGISGDWGDMLWTVQTRVAMQF